jgi:FtsK/SpoIIIE family/FtsK alpha domain
MHDLRARIQPAIGSSARMTCDFIEKLAPESPYWLLGASIYGQWRWKTFQGAGRRAMAERWVHAAYQQGAELWFTIGEVAAPLEREPKDGDIAATRLVAAYADRTDALLGGPRPPHVAYYSASGHAIGVWRLTEAINMGKAHWEASAFSAESCTKASSVLPMSRCIPLPPDLYPVGYQGGCMARMAFAAPPYRPHSEVRLLASPGRGHDGASRPAIAEDRARADELVREIAQFKVFGSVTESRVGPVVSTFFFVPAPGTKGSKVEDLADDIGRVMRVDSARVVPIPRSDALGIEIPNEDRKTVMLQALLESPEFVDSQDLLPIALGVNTFAEPIVRDVVDGPHWLVAGTTGSGKSVAVNDMILSLITKQTPEQCRLLLVDPKFTEFAVYDGVPHLLAPVINTKPDALKALRWLLNETTERYKLFNKVRGARKLSEYNAEMRRLGEAEIPYIVAFVDEVADLFTFVGEKNSEDAKLAAAIKAIVQKLAQIARAAGVHMVLSMQRPSADIIDGAIRANFLARLAFKAASRHDAGVIDVRDSDKCLGMGDGLYRESSGVVTRVHSGFISGEDIVRIVDALCAERQPDYVDMGDEDSEGGGESDNQEIVKAPGGKRRLDDVLKELLQEGPKSRKDLFSAAKANGYKSEGVLSSSLERIGAYTEGREGFQGTAIYRLR